MKVFQNTPSLCRINTSNLSVLDQELIVYSQFKYDTIKTPGVELALWILLSLAVVCNFGVIIVRCKCWRGKYYGETSPVSILLVNLAVSDILMASGKIAFLIIMKLSNAWCQEATKTITHLCFSAFTLSLISSAMSEFIILTIAALGYKQIAGCHSACTRKRTIAAVLFLVWTSAIVIPIVIGTDKILRKFTLTTGIEFESQIINWRRCWAYDVFPHNSAERYEDWISLSLYGAVTVAIGVLLTATVTATCCQTNKRQYLQIKQLICRLASVVATSLSLTLLQISWDVFLLVTEQNFSSLSNQTHFQYYAVAAALSIPCLSLTVV